MNDALLLDTHAWLWLELGDSSLPITVQQSIRQAANTESLFLSAISLHEIAYASLRGRVHLQIDLAQWFLQALADPAPAILALTPAIAVASASLPPAFHGDPADRMIAATAIVHNLILCTHDRRLLHFGRQGLFRFLEV